MCASGQRTYTPVSAEKDDKSKEAAMEDVEDNIKLHWTALETIMGLVNPDFGPEFELFVHIAQSASGQSMCISAETYLST